MDYKLILYAIICDTASFSSLIAHMNPVSLYNTSCEESKSVGDDYDITIAMASSTEPRARQQSFVGVTGQIQPPLVTWQTP